MHAVCDQERCATARTLNVFKVRAMGTRSVMLFVRAVSPQSCQPNANQKSVGRLWHATGAP